MTYRLPYRERIQLIVGRLCHDRTERQSHDSMRVEGQANPPSATHTLVTEASEIVDDESIHRLCCDFLILTIRDLAFVLWKRKISERCADTRSLVTLAASSKSALASSCRLARAEALAAIDRTQKHFCSTMKGNKVCIAHIEFLELGMAYQIRFGRPTRRLEREERLHSGLKEKH